jgi:hypothetical protein
MTIKRDARLKVTGAWTLAAWGAANSSTKYTTYCEICRIPTIETPCLTCQAWCDAGHHIQLAAHAMKSMQPKPTMKKKGENHER